MPTLKVKNNGIWETVSGIGGSGGDTSLPTGGTVGQVLTIGEDGNPVWADATGGDGGSGDVPSAKGVEF